MKKQDTKRKNQSKRSKSKYPALTKGLNARVRTEFIDYDYIDQLNEDEKKWLNKFTEEYINASFKNDESDFIQDQEDKRKIYNQNNARNRDLYGQIRNKVGNTKLLNYEDSLSLVESQNSSVNPEDAIIDFLDVEFAMTEYVNFMETFTESTG